MNIAQTHFWIDREPKSIGIRSSNRKNGSQPFECYLTRYWNLLDCNVYETGDECDHAEYRLSFKLLWFSLNMLLWKSQRITKARCEDSMRWGWLFMDRRSLVLQWRYFYKNFDLPFVSRVFIRSELLSLDRKRVVYVHPRCGGFEGKEYERRKEAEERHSASFPYRYELLSGEAQEVTATIHVNRYIRRLKWTPFKQIEDSIDVKFSDEVGPERGSWKGGCIGCGYDLKPKETAIQCLRRMERERRFER